MDCFPLTDLSSVQISILTNYVYRPQAVFQVQNLNELISGHVRNLSDIWILLFY